MRLRKALTAVLTGGLAASLLVGAPAILAFSSAGAAAPPLRDGSISSRAAASCWEIKQLRPSSPDGVYWLQTPQLIAPDQFYCDMTTDGGGWVVVGRGRENWNWLNNGQGQPSVLRGTVSGPGAFAPAALPAQTINGLLGGLRLDALPDGIRLRRATDTAGTRWQEMRLMPTARPNWTWSFGGGIRLSAVKADGVTYSGTLNTQSWSNNGDQQFLRMTTTDDAVHNYERGFAFGTSVAGANNSTSYLWTYSTEKQALPFTTISLRPKLTSPTYPAVPGSGTAASHVRPLMKSTTEPAPWGVAGVVGGGTGEYNMEVEDFAFVGDRAFVGGKFQYVQKGKNPAAADKVAQSYLAAFDVNTGEWISTFRPVVNGMVWALNVTPDGKLIVGGDFTSINGTADTAGLAALDPATGAVVPGWRAPVAYPNGALRVRGLDVQGNWLYVAGSFSKISGGVPLGAQVTVGNAARVALADGKVDGTWKPHFDGPVYELDASAQGDRVYYVGRFNNVNHAASANLGVVSTSAGAATVTGLTPWVVALGSGTQTYQQTILEDGSSVWQGGSQHILSRYARSNYAVLNSNITKNGGDFQALAPIDGVVYAGSHSGHYNYSGTSNYSTPIPYATDVNNTRFVGAYDAATGEDLPEFLIAGLDGRQGQGAWALRKGPDGCLWLGGDFTQGSWRNGAYDWLGGFGKVCPRDTTSPSAPTALTATPNGSSVVLKWNAATDNSGSVTYEILRDDRVVATTTAATWTDAEPDAPSTYWVRAVDATQNRSASTASVTVQTVSPDTTPPSQVTGLTVTGTTSAAVNLSWDAATDDRGVTGYVVSRNGTALAGSVAGTTFADTGVAPSTTYTYTVSAVDAAGNTGPASSSVQATTAGDSAVLASDSFGGADGSPWASPWASSTSGGTVTVQSGAGDLTVSDVSGAYARSALGATAVADSDLLLSYQWKPASASAYLNVWLRGSGGWQNGYRPKSGYGLQLTSTSTAASFQKNVAGTVTTLATVSGAQTVGTGKQWLRLRAVGSTVQFRIWADGQAEPSTWTSTQTDSGVTAAGQVFVSLNRGASNVGAKTVSIDDLTLRRM